MYIGTSNHGTIFFYNNGMWIDQLCGAQLRFPNGGYAQRPCAMIGPIIISQPLVHQIQGP